MPFFLSIFRLFLALFFVSCSFSGCSIKRDERYYKEQSAAIQKRLGKLLSSVHTLKEIQHIEKKMAQDFDDLAKLMIEIEEESKSNLFFQSFSEEKESVILQRELERVLLIPGAEEIISRSQEAGYKKLQKYAQSVE